MDEVDDEELNAEEAKERKILRMLLKIKNGTPPQRKTALRQITDKARDFGAGPLFNQILPLLMSPTLEDQERHLLVKVRQRWRGGEGVYREGGEGFIGSGAGVYRAGWYIFMRGANRVKKKCYGERKKGN